ncbi:MAG: rhamnan synthesis protein F [Lachnospiraceae bacterium]|nr:rhamnan synthesis protein F [Lachnospiraceae bacterium]
MIVNSDNAKRCAIYVFFDKDGIVDEYNFYFLKELKKVISRLIVICNGKINDKGLEGFRALTDEIIVRPNEGFDITAYKMGIEHISYDQLVNYDEIIVSNSTNFGPFYPFSEMFGLMAQKDLDFWGITNFHEVPFDPFGTIEYGYIPKHIQSFFMVFRKSLCAEENFVKYWKALPVIHNYNEAVGFFETVFTKKFEEKGYKWDVYVDSSDLEGYTYDPLRDYPRYVIEKKKCPVIKRRSFFHDYGEALSRSGGEATREAFEYIRDHTDYNIDMIWDNLLRLQNQADLKKRMQLNYIISSSLPKTVMIDQSLKVALIIHIYYEDLAEYCCKYAQSMPKNVDIIVTVPSEEKLGHVKDVFRRLKDYSVEYRVVGNRGRDVAPFLVGCKDLIDRYDLICKVHDKKVYQVLPMSVGASWAYKCFENLIKNELYVENVIKTFQENPRLGLLTPPVPNHAPYYPTTGKGEWGENFDVAHELAKKLGMNIDMDSNKEPIAPLGSMFWVRTKALKVLFDHDWQYDEFPEEPIDTDATVLHAIERIYPFCVQHEGYYPAWVMADTYARIELTNWGFINRKLEQAAFKKVGITNYHELLGRIKQL